MEKKGNNSKNYQEQQSLVVDEKIEPLAVALGVFCFK